MVKLNKIYTKTGDDGTTGLVAGPRRPKFDLRVAAYGTVDEANATLGLVRLHAADLTELDQVILRVQNDLFDLGSDLATPDTGKDLGFEPLRIIESQVTWLENTIDHFNAHLEPIKSFTLPGGSALASYLHLSRTVVRRAERDAIELKAQEADVNGEAIKYLNRLSDLLFVLSRIANDNGASDILWTPGKHR